MQLEVFRKALMQSLQEDEEKPVSCYYYYFHFLALFMTMSELILFFNRGREDYYCLFNKWETLDLLFSVGFLLVLTLFCFIYSFYFEECIQI